MPAEAQAEASAATSGRQEVLLWAGMGNLWLRGDFVSRPMITRVCLTWLGGTGFSDREVFVLG